MRFSDTLRNYQPKKRTLHKALVNHDDLHAQAKSKNITDLSMAQVDSDSARSLLVESLRTAISTAETGVPACRCGEIRGVRNLGVFHSDSKCRSVVTPYTANGGFTNWLSCPPEIAGFINPMLYIMLVKRFTYKRINVIAYLTKAITLDDPSIGKIVTIIDGLRRVQLYERGYDFFARNIFGIVAALEAMPEFRPSSCKRRTFIRSEGRMIELGRHVSIMSIMDMYRDACVTSWLAVPNREALIEEQTALGRYTGSHVPKTLQVTMSLAGIRTRRLTKVKRESIMAKAMEGLRGYGLDLLTSQYQGKKKVIRGHGLGMKIGAMTRCVIEPHVEPHNYDGITMNWVSFINMKRPEIISKLVSKGFGHRRIQDMLREADYAVVPEIDTVIDELFVDAGGRVPMQMLRNPSLLPESIQYAYIDQVNRDMTDACIHLSDNNAVSYNLDYDGDQMPVAGFTSEEEAYTARTRHLTNRLMSVREPWRFGPNVALSKPAVLIIGNWYARDDKAHGVKPIPYTAESAAELMQLYG